MARLSDRRQKPPYPPSGPRPPADPALQQRVWAALMLGVISLFAIMMMTGNVRRGVYVVAVALVIAAIALWLSLSAMSRARRGGSGRPRGAVLSVVTGAAGFIISGFVLFAFAMFWPQVTQYATCMSGANTVVAQQACQQQLNNSIGTEIGILGR